MPRPKKAMPAYRYHVSGQAVVTLGGKDYYLGPHNSSESHAKYLTLIGEYQRNGLKPPEQPTHQKDIPVTVAAVTAEFRSTKLPSFDHNASQHGRFDNLCTLLDDEYGDVPAAEFGPRKLAAIRELLVADGNCRKYVNSQIRFIIRIFQHAVARELIQAEQLVALRALEPLKIGEAKDNPPRQPADIALVRATLSSAAVKSTNAFNTAKRSAVFRLAFFRLVRVVIGSPKAHREIRSTDQRCTQDDLVIFYQGRTGQTYDEQILPNARLTDIDREIVHLYRTMRHTVDPAAEELNWSDEDLLEAVGAIRLTADGPQPTVAGVLLFGTAMALRRLFPMMRIDYIRVPGTRWVKDPDRRFDTVEIRSPLIRAINRARSAVLDDIPKAFSLPPGETQSREVPTLPDRVIREVVANAAMHRDYRVHGSIQLIRYSNRLEIRNPGYSLKARERLGEPGSDTRNPVIAAVLHDLKLAETKGSGIRVMREELRGRGLQPPLLESDRTDWRWQSEREPPWQPKTGPGGLRGGDLGVPVL